MKRRMGTAVATAMMALALDGSFGVSALSADIEVPETIDAAGGRDVTDELARFLSTAPHGSTIRFPDGGRYRIEGRVEVRGQRDLTIEGDGALLFATQAGDEHRRHLSFVDSTNVTIRNLRIKGANPHAGTGEDAYDASREAQHGFDFHAVKGLLLEGVTVTDVWGDFVYLGPNRGTMERTEDVVIRNSTFERNGRQGIAIVHARNVLIERNRISQTRRATFDLEPNRKELAVDDIRIVDNDIGDGRLLFLAAHGRGTVNNVVVMNNRLADRPMNVSVKGPDNGEVRQHFRIIDNRGDGTWSGDGAARPDAAAIRFRRVLDVEVRGNYQRIDGDAGGAGVLSSQACVTVDDNEFPGTDEALRIEEPLDCSDPRPPAAAPKAANQQPEAQADANAGRSEGVGNAEASASEPTPSDDGNGTGVLVGGGLLLLVSLALLAVRLKRRHRKPPAEDKPPVELDVPVGPRSWARE